MEIAQFIIFSYNISSVIFIPYQKQEQPMPKLTKISFTLFRVMILLIILQLASSYAIQGNWSLISLQKASVSDQNISVQITDFVLRNTSIHHKISFNGCKKFKLQATIQQNKIFFSSSSYEEQAIKDINCTNSTAKNLENIFRKLREVFYFSINSDKLAFINPFGNTVFVFKRIITSYSDNISGLWIITQYNNTKTSLSIEISPNQIAFCQGNAVYNYTLDTKMRIISINSLLANCPAIQLINSFQSIKYYQMRKGMLIFYDQNVSLAIQLNFSKHYDAKNTLNQVFVSNKTSKDNISAQKIVQIWQVRSLFKIPIISSKYTLQFTQKGRLKLSGGCKDYQFNYKLNSGRQLISISEQDSKNVEKNSKCAKSDDQLYINGIVKMHKYVFSSVDGTQIINFYDENGQVGYSLALKPRKNINVSNTTNTFLSAGNKTNIQNTRAALIQKPLASQQKALSPGKYILLLLQRRDLLRLSVTIDKNTMSYKGCNHITQPLQIIQSKEKINKIKIRSGSKTKIGCPKDNDEIYIGTLISAQKFTFDSNLGVVILKNAGGIQIASITKA